MTQIVLVFPRAYKHINADEMSWNPEKMLSVDNTRWVASQTEGEP